MGTITKQELAEEFQDGYNPKKSVEFANNIQERLDKEANEFAGNNTIAKDALKILFMSIASRYILQNTELLIKFNNLEEKNKIMKEALELIKHKSPRCDCMDAPGIASEALEKVGE